jgi:hypothetical protein
MKSGEYSSKNVPPESSRNGEKASGDSGNFSRLSFAENGFLLTILPCRMAAVFRRQAAGLSPKPGKNREFSKSGRPFSWIPFHRFFAKTARAIRIGFSKKQRDPAARGG